MCSCTGDVEPLDEHDGGEGGGFGNGGVEARCRVEIRRMRLAGESNPWLIVTTVAVSSLDRKGSTFGSSSKKILLLVRKEKKEREKEGILSGRV